MTLQYYSYDKCVLCHDPYVRFQTSIIIDDLEYEICNKCWTLQYLDIWPVEVNFHGPIIFCLCNEEDITLGKQYVLLENYQNFGAMIMNKYKFDTAECLVLKHNNDTRLTSISLEDLYIKSLEEYKVASIENRILMETERKNLQKDFQSFFVRLAYEEYEICDFRGSAAFRHERIKEVTQDKKHANSVFDKLIKKSEFRFLARQFSRSISKSKKTEFSQCALSLIVQYYDDMNLWEYNKDCVIKIFLNKHTLLIF